MENLPKSPHILNTSATLLGLCFVVLTSFHSQNQTTTTIIDDVTAGAVLMFMMSSIFSFLSIRSTKHAETLESAADYIFLFGLLYLFATTILIVFNIVR